MQSGPIITTNPMTLNVIETDTNCPSCLGILTKELKHGRRLVGSECGRCSYLDRPFAYCSNGLYSDQECYCTYGPQDYLYISCLTCLDAIKEISRQKAESLRILDKEKFNNTWKKSTPAEKLDMYGIKKLHILAKNKKIKGVSKLRKDELKSILLPVITDMDFPIK